MSLTTPLQNDDDSPRLSHQIISQLAHLEDDRKGVAQVFHETFVREGQKTTLRMWRDAELLYWIHRENLWMHILFVDDEGDERKFKSFEEYMNTTTAIPYKYGWAYILRGCYETYRVKLDLGEHTPKEMRLLLDYGSFEKLYKLRKVIKTIEDLYFWLDATRDTPANDVEEQIMEIRFGAEKKTIIVKGPKKRRYKSERLPLDGIAKSTRQMLQKLIPELENIPDNSIVEFIARIVDYQEDIGNGDQAEE